MNLLNLPPRPVVTSYLNQQLSPSLTNNVSPEINMKSTSGILQNDALSFANFEEFFRNTNSIVTTPADKDKLRKRQGACERCRMKKRKCDGEQPCKNCANAISRKALSPDGCVYSSETSKSRKPNQSGIGTDNMDSDRESGLPTYEVNDREESNQVEINDKESSASPRAGPSRAEVSVESPVKVRSGKIPGYSFVEFQSGKSKMNPDCPDPAAPNLTPSQILMLTPSNGNELLKIPLRSVSSQLMEPITSLSSPPELIAHLIGLFYKICTCRGPGFRISESEFFRDLFPANKHSSFLLLSMCAFSVRFSSHPHLYQPPFHSPFAASHYFLALARDHLEQASNFEAELSLPLFEDKLKLLYAMSWYAVTEYAGGFPRFATIGTVKSCRIRQSMDIIHPEFTKINPLFNVWSVVYEQMHKDDRERQERIKNTIIKYRSPQLYQQYKEVQSLFILVDTLCAAAGGVSVLGRDDEFTYLLERPVRPFSKPLLNDPIKRIRMQEDIDSTQDVEADVERYLLNSAEEYGLSIPDKNSLIIQPIRNTNDIEDNRAHLLSLFQFRKVLAFCRTLQNDIIRGQITSKNAILGDCFKEVFETNKNADNQDLEIMRLHDSTLRMYFALPYARIRAIDTLAKFVLLSDCKLIRETGNYSQPRDPTGKRTAEDDSANEWTEQFYSLATNLWVFVSLSYLNISKNETGERYYIFFDQNADKGPEIRNSCDADPSQLLNSNDVILASFHATCFVMRTFLGSYGWLDKENYFKRNLREGQDKISTIPQKYENVPGPLVYNVYISLQLYTIAVAAISMLTSRSSVNIVSARIGVSRIRGSTRAEECEELKRELNGLIIPIIRFQAKWWTGLQIYAEAIEVLIESL
ncbi:hypothetical protein HK098_007056 [Nowakowskiella sp. JEL0407]|nr:hypothetical protein HK098_007056 [Nowakowskiella sp. JEL0407]